MKMVHKKDGGIIKSSGKGDWGICDKCGKRVDHLLMKKGELIFNEEVELK